jgi:hypothetical protein
MIFIERICVEARALVVMVIKGVTFQPRFWIL